MRVQAALSVFLTASAIALAGSYDPLATPGAGTVEVRELTVRDADRDRDIPLRVYLPAERKKAPVVLFSHGLGGSNKGSAYLGNHWAARGYVAVFLQHPGSDTDVWKEAPLAKRMAEMRKAASGQNFMLRVKDVPAVLDQLEVWNKEDKHLLHGRLDVARVGMSGHSFGAVTTQAVSGQNFGLAGTRFTDRRIKAALPMSPSSPKRGDPTKAFGAVKIPWLLMTGTKDTSLIGTTDVASRMAVFPALPAGQKYLLVLDRAEHSAFTERRLPGDSEPRNANHHRAILALSTAFWDAHLRGSKEASRWLDGPGARAVLQPKDRWERR